MRTDVSVNTDTTSLYDRKIVIPVPIPLERRRGLRSLNSTGRAVATRMHEDDLTLIDAEAAVLGITRGEFTRWVTAYAAKVLRKDRTGENVEITP